MIDKIVSYFLDENISVLYNKIKFIPKYEVNLKILCHSHTNFSWSMSYVDGGLIALTWLEYFH